MYFRQDIFSARYPFGKISFRQDVFGIMSFGKMSFGEVGGHAKYTLNSLSTPTGDADRV